MDAAENGCAEELHHHPHHVHLLPRVKLGGQGMEVSRQGLGCMGMSANYGHPKPEEHMISFIRSAIHSHALTFFDTAEVYGPHTNETLLGKAIKGIPRQSLQIATKFGSGIPVRGDPQYVRAACEGSLKRLDVDYIDLYYQHRVDRSIPIEVTVGEMKKLVEEGKVKYIGLSEASASTIRRAHAVHPITAVQMEWSLWSRDVEEEIIPTCRELGIGIVSYSPLGRGFLSSGAKLLQNLEENDRRKHMFPRFQGEAIEKNAILFEKLSQFATKKGCTPGQVALAWIHHQGQDVVPIPGTTKPQNLNENLGALKLKLTMEEIIEIESFFDASLVVGGRYQNENWTFVEGNTPPLSTWKCLGV